MKILLSFMLSFFLMPCLMGQEVLEIKDQEVSIVIDGKALKGSLTKGAGGMFSQERVALFISGSGATDRDGNSLPKTKNNSLKYLAHEITRSGISTLRVDKRGIAASRYPGLREEDLRFQTNVDDITSWIDFLQKKGYKEVVLIGHSEGALVAILAAKHPAVIGIVSLAGAGRPAAVVLKEQLKKNTLEFVAKIADNVIDHLAAGKKVDDVPAMFHSLFRPSIQPYLISWFRIDPAKEIKKLDMAALIIQGTTDIQITVGDAKLLHKAAKNSKLHIITGMNHVLKKADGDSVKQEPSYVSPDFPLMEDVAEFVTEFIQGLEGE